MAAQLVGARPGDGGVGGGSFLAGRVSHRQDSDHLASAGQVRERILLVAVGDHLDRSQMVLAELSNAPDGKGKINISKNRSRPRS